MDNNDWKCVWLSDKWPVPITNLRLKFVKIVRMSLDWLTLSKPLQVDFFTILSIVLWFYDSPLLGFCPLFVSHCEVHTNALYHLFWGWSWCVCLTIPFFLSQISLSKENVLFIEFLTNKRLSIATSSTNSGCINQKKPCHVIRCESYFALESHFFLIEAIKCALCLLNDNKWMLFLVI